MGRHRTTPRSARRRHIASGSHRASGRGCGGAPRRRRPRARGSRDARAGGLAAGPNDRGRLRGECRGAARRDVARPTYRSSRARAAANRGAGRERAPRHRRRIRGRCRPEATRSPRSLTRSRSADHGGRTSPRPRREDDRPARGRGSAARHRPSCRDERNLGEARSAHRRRVGAGATAPVPLRADPRRLPSARASRAYRGHAPRTVGRLRLPPRRRCARPARERSHPRRRGFVSGDDAGASAPAGAERRARREGAPKRGAVRGSSMQTASLQSWRRQDRLGEAVAARFARRASPDARSRFSASSRSATRTPTSPAGS